MGRGLSVASQAKRDALGGARAELENYLEAVGGLATFRAVGVEMRKTAFFEDLAREGLSRASPLDASVALFPDVFEIYGSGATRGIRLRRPT